jgi:zinc protease
MKKTFALLLVVFASVFALDAQTPSGDIPKLDVEKYTLPNGLEVILSEDHRVPLVGVDVWYHVGPAHEAAGRTGFAHLFEHMMFQGSKHIESDAHFRLLAGAGASGVNGTTNFDRTNYFETMPSNQLELALWLESDRMGYLLETVDQAKLSNQQDVVRNERRQSYENRPYGIVEEAMFQALFPKGHPYHGVVIGSHADIQAAKLEDVRDFFRQYYAPNNATIAIAGDIDKAATKKLIEKYFGTLKRGPAVPPVTAKTPPVTAERRLVVEDNVEVPRIYMAWLTPPFFKEGDADADIASSILGQGRVSRLYKKLEYEKQIAQNVTAYQYSTMLGSIFGIEATARPGHTLQELEAVINEEIEALRTKGPTAAEVERARNVLETQIFNGLQLVGGFGGVADQLNLYNHYTGNPDYLAQDIARRRKVTPESVRQFAQRYLAPNARVVVHGVPGKQNLGPEVPKPAEQAATSAAPTVSINADEPWRATKPGAGAAKAVRVPVPQSFELPNGLTVIALPQTGGVPVVSANLVLRSGSDANPLDKPGLASFTADLLDQGTTTRSATQIAEEVAQIGASLDTGTSRDATTISTSSLSRNFPVALALVADVALRPSFPNEEVERVRGTRLADIAQQRSNPAQVVGVVTGKTLYGTHQYGFPEVGTVESNKQLTRADLQAFWKQHFVPGNAALVVTGAITVAELRKLAQTTFGDWPKGTASPAKLGVPTTTPPRLVIVDRPGSPQTQLRVATFGVPRSSPDYMPVRVMNTILGGMFASRINMNLREEHGYTYGANSQFPFWRSGGPFSVATGVRTDVTAPAVHEVMAELKEMGETRVTPEELTLAKDAITLQLPALFETNDRTAASLSTLFTHGLPLNYYSNLAEQISVVDAQAVQDVAKKYLLLDKFAVVAVGDRAKIAEPLEKELGTKAEIRDADGQPIKKMGSDPRTGPGVRPLIQFTVPWASRQPTADHGGPTPSST